VGIVEDLRSPQVRKNAKCYRKDADALMLLDRIFMDPENQVSEWKSVHCAQRGSGVLVATTWMRGYGRKKQR
jgi:hypothetical protein